MMKKNLIFVFVGLVVVFCGSLLWRECCEQGSGVSEPDKAVRVLDRLSQKAFSDLAVAVGAEGLYLLPYPYAEDLSEVQLFSGGALAGLTSSTGTYTWWLWHGNGEPIDLTFDEYYEKYIWDANYLEAPEIFTGSAVLDRGNTLMALRTLFPGAEVIEYHFPWLNEMEWTSLYLVFVKTGEDSFLRAIAHGQWTI